MEYTNKNEEFTALVSSAHHQKNAVNLKKNLMRLKPPKVILLPPYIFSPWCFYAGAQGSLQPCSVALCRADECAPRNVGLTGILHASPPSNGPFTTLESFISGSLHPSSSHLCVGSIVGASARARPGRLSALSVSILNQLRVPLLYGCARRLTVLNGSFRPGRSRP
jgi:hypothetical protein